jgi:predicted RNA polymerase sigma factor
MLAGYGPDMNTHSQIPRLTLLRRLCAFARHACARIDASGRLSSFLDQDRSRWDSHLIDEGQRQLDLSASGPQLTEYHLEAAIAWVHSMAHRADETDWPRIVSLYDTLMALRPSSIVALNRAIAIGQRDGPERGLQEIRGISDHARLAMYPFYYAALGEFEFRSGRHESACEHFQTALTFARNPSERQFFENRIATFEGPTTQQVL